VVKVSERAIFLSIRGLASNESCRHHANLPPHLKGGWTMNLLLLMLEVAASTLTLITAALKLISAVVRNKKVSPDKD
jgi:ABC-type arginine/histidine transport system permease subunit